jgi:hypothetical protein
MLVFQDLRLPDAKRTAKIGNKVSFTNAGFKIFGRGGINLQVGLKTTKICIIDRFLSDPNEKKTSGILVDCITGFSGHPILY